jgi:hypothetical protein
LPVNSETSPGLPLHLRKTNLEQLLRGRSDGIFVILRVHRYEAAASN